ncbi:MAG: hypothetical protein RR543_00220 [Erysipelotrichales bacterium]
MENVRVIKVGGSSLATIEKIEDIARKLVEAKEKIVLVVSAMGNTTDKLLELGCQVNDEGCAREFDMLLATGEQVSATLMSMALQKLNKKALALTGFQAQIQVEGVHQKAVIKDIEIDVVKQYLDKYDFIVVAGFQGVNKENDFMTLGRGGSDTTAVALAAKLDCSCEIYTDVEGVFSADPRKVEGAHKLDSICYEEMLELALSGSGVLEPRSVELALRYSVPIYVGQLTSNISGTWIRS